MTEILIDSLLVKIFESRNEMGINAAGHVVQNIKSLLNKKEYVNVLFAAAPSQNEFLQYLVEQKEIDWGWVNAFHMDEYIGLPDNAPQRFSNFLKGKLFNKISFASGHFLDGNARNPQQECRRYADLLSRYPTDIACMGIGENTHIAFNDPHVADFKDIERVKIVHLDNACRQQQVNDGCFEKSDQVPTTALTLTIPALLSAKYIYCIAPGKNKSNAVNLTLTEKISEKYPASILRRHKNCQLFLDKDSSEKFENEILRQKANRTC